MAVTKAKKIEQVEALTKEFQDAKHGIVGTFSKMTVEKDFELRKAVRSAGGRYRVLKNTLAARRAHTASGLNRDHANRSAGDARREVQSQPATFSHIVGWNDQSLPGTNNPPAHQVPRSESPPGRATAAER